VIGGTPGLLLSSSWSVPFWTLPGIPGRKSRRSPGEKSRDHGYSVQRWNQTGYPDFGLVPGDVIQLTAGDIARQCQSFIAAKDFFIDQSALTGESFSGGKTIDPITEKTDSTKWNNYLFMGTSVTAGSATAVIVKTGGATEYGEIAKKNAERKRKPNLKQG